MSTETSTTARTRGRRGPLGAFRDLRTAQKLLAGFLLMCVVVVGVGLLGLSKVASTEAAARDIYARGAVPLKDLTEARVANGGMRQRVLLHLAGPVADKPAREEQIVELDAKFDEEIADFGEQFTDQELLGRYVAAVAEYRAFRDDVILPASRAQAQDVGPVLAECDRLYGIVVGLGDQLGDAQVAEVEATAVQAHETYASARVLIFAAMGFAVVLGVALALGLGRLVASPLRRAVGVLEGLAAGRLDQRLEVGTRDEVGDMAHALNTAISTLGTAMAQIAGNASTLSSASEQMKATSTQLSASAAESATQAGVVSAAADEVSMNVRTVAAGTDEMGAAIREISSNAAEATQVASQAVTAAQATNRTISKLGESSKEIGDVVKVITSIAEQTNLLALNATIEAARAGEAGKGFAVVANEVKELAQETARATEDIARRVESIQSDTAGAVGAIEEISEVIAQINDRQTTIASAVEEQTATTNEMARNVAEAAAGAGQIAANVTVVASAAQETTAGASATGEAAEELSRMAGELQQLVGRFRY
ncbi:methyl-accepting chemotaxis protein [Quadrisphaera sp. DSM 44207]|uniref:methyl-accepting chemotaxis protein n=1 Tax=Quadrisphaera sp. DSM 44207 TaxID=1881057 RepID=UPI000890E25E|nr:methyl-accepting chemotaxis protein [Quadrisphaera sp. DSM 44207]SDQ11678.1 methyl-accepting chemotaxis protein [Quadrisphaera sp. DSM 44207]